MAAEWAVPVIFIQEPLASENPSTFSTLNADMMKQAADIRCERALAPTIGTNLWSIDPNQVHG